MVHKNIEMSIGDILESQNRKVLQDFRLIINDLTKLHGSKSTEIVTGNNRVLSNSSGTILFNGFEDYSDLLEDIKIKSIQARDFISNSIKSMSNLDECRLFLIDIQALINEAQYDFKAANDIFFDIPVKGKYGDPEVRIKNFNITWDQGVIHKVIGYPEEWIEESREIILTISSFQYDQLNNLDNECSRRLKKIESLSFDAVKALNPKLNHNSRKIPTGFKYEYYKEKDYIKDLFNLLYNGGFLGSETNFNMFLIVFSGKQIKYKVRWNGTSDEFAYFIKLLCKESDLISKLKNTPWRTACNCFMSQDESDFDPKKLKGAKIPSNSSKTIENIVKTFINYHKHLPF